MINIVANVLKKKKLVRLPSPAYLHCILMKIDIKKYHQPEIQQQRVNRIMHEFNIMPESPETIISLTTCQDEALEFGCILTSEKIPLVK